MPLDPAFMHTRHDRENVGFQFCAAALFFLGNNNSTFTLLVFDSNNNATTTTTQPTEKYIAHQISLFLEI